MNEKVRALILEYIREAANSAGRDYLRKEAVKDVVQAALIERVNSGEISGQDGVDEFFATVDMAVRALRMIPFEVLRAQKGASKKTKRSR